MMPAAQPGAADAAVRTRPLTPRMRRALQALLAGPQSREQLDRTAGCSNSPDLVSRLNLRLGVSIKCAMHAAVDRDNNPVEFGVYELPAGDRGRVRALLMMQPPP